MRIRFSSSQFKASAILKPFNFQVIGGGGSFYPIILWLKKNQKFYKKSFIL